MASVKVHCAAVYVLLVIAQNAAAVQPEAASEQEFLEALPVVLSVSRLAQPLTEAPAAVTVIDQDMIRVSGFTEIADLLRLVPGFNVAYTRGLHPTATYHGLADGFSRRMQVVVDGRPVYDPNFGEVNWSELPLAMEDIDHIEVVRGPNAAAYGANAFLAVINIVTRHASDNPGSFVSLGSGENGMGRAVYRYGGAVKDLNYRLTVSSREANRFGALPDTARETFINLRGDHRISNTDELLVQMGYAQGAQGQGFKDSVFDIPRKSHTEAGFVQLHWHRVQDGQNELSLQYFHSSFRNVDEWLAPGLPAPIFVLPVSLAYSAGRDDIEFQQILSPLKNVRAVWGLGVRQDRARSPSYYGTSETYSGDSQRLFGHVEWRITPQLLVHGGAMLERHFFTGTGVSPRFVLNYLPVPDHSFRIGFTKGLRTPTFTEQKSNQSYTWSGILLDQRSVPPPGMLRPEEILSREIGYVGEFRKIGVTLDVRLFQDSFKDMIGSTKVPIAPVVELLGDGTAYSYRNLHTVTMSGFEYQVHWRPSAATRVVLSQGLLKLDSSDTETAHSGPSDTSSLLVSHSFPAGVDGSFGFYKVGAMTWLGDGDPVARYDRLDLRLSKHFGANRSNNEIALTVQNALRYYSEFRPDYQFDRRAFVTLTFGM